MTTEAWKIERYQDLAFEVQGMDQLEVVVVPFVMGAVGSRNSLGRLCEMPRIPGNIPDMIGIAEISALLGTAHICHDADEQEVERREKKERGRRPPNMAL